jgi:hypothetical protein
MRNFAAAKEGGREAGRPGEGKGEPRRHEATKKTVLRALGALIPDFVIFVSSW